MTVANHLGAPLLAFTLLVACGGGGSAMGSDAGDGAMDAAVDADAAADADGDGGLPFVVAMPMAPRWTCPEGWSASTFGGAISCAPSLARPSCGAGEARFVGSPDCVAVGDACPTGEFADGLPADAVFVRPGASGPGTREAPVGTLLAGLARVRPGGTVALAAGDYDGAYVLDDVTIVGACSARARLVWAEALVDRAVLAIPPGQRATVRGVTITNALSVGIASEGQLELDGVVVDGSVGAGILVSGGTLSGHEVVIRGTSPRGSSGGQGLFVSGGVVSGGPWHLSANAKANAIVGDTGVANLEDLLSLDPVAMGLTSAGLAFDVTPGGQVSLTRAALLGSSNVVVESQGAVVRLDQVYIDEVVEVLPRGVAALTVREAGELHAEGLFVRGVGFLVESRGESTLSVSDAVFVNTGEGTLWTDDISVSIVDTMGSLDRVHVVGGGAGVAISGPFDFSLPPLDGEPDPPADEPLIEFRVADLVVEGVGEHPRFGYGLIVENGVDVEMERVRVERARGINVSVRDARLVLEDATLIDPLPGLGADGDPNSARALTVDDGADVTLRRAHVRGMLEVAIEGRDGELALEDVWVEDTRERACAETSCADAPGGIGVGAYLGARVTAAGLFVDGAALCGLQVALDGELDVRDSRIRGAVVGACVQVDGYDVGRLTGGVRYEDNGTNVESTSHAVPDPPPPPVL